MSDPLNDSEFHFLAECLPRGIDPVTIKPYWRNQLGENIGRLLQHCLDAGYLVPATTEQALNHFLSKEDLVAQLSARLLPSSGTKSALIARMLSRCPEWVRSYLSVRQFYVQTDAGVAWIEELWAARMRVDHSAAYMRDLADYRKTPFIVGIRIISRADIKCSNSSKIAGCYRLADAPDWPPSECDSEMGCLCWWVSIHDDEAERLTFKSAPA